MNDRIFLNAPKTTANRMARNAKALRMSKSKMESGYERNKLAARDGQRVRIK